jgi:hypothetical protein
MKRKPVPIIFTPRPERPLFDMGIKFDGKRWHDKNTGQFVTNAIVSVLHEQKRLHDEAPRPLPKPVTKHVLAFEATLFASQVELQVDDVGDVYSNDTAPKAEQPTPNRDDGVWNDFPLRQIALTQRLAEQALAAV